LTLNIANSFVAFSCRVWRRSLLVLLVFSDGELTAISLVEAELCSWSLVPIGTIAIEIAYVGDPGLSPLDDEAAHNLLRLHPRTDQSFGSVNLYFHYSHVLKSP